MGSSAGLLLYSSRSRSYSRRMISGARQWPFKPTPGVFRFAKISCLLIPPELPRSHGIIVGLLALRLLAKSSTSKCDGQVLSEDYELRDTSGNFFQFYCMPLQQEKARILHNISWEHPRVFSQRILFFVWKNIERYRSWCKIKIFSLVKS